MCGVAAWLGKGAWDAVYWLLLGLQHRGQDAAGAAVLGPSGVWVDGGAGLVREALEPGRAGDAEVAIGHVRYSTSGDYSRFQPVVSPRRHIAVAFNGNITNYVEAYREVVGGEPPGWDAEALASILEQLYLDHGSLVDAVREAAGLLAGAYSLVALSVRGELLAARDPWGVRPLAYSLGDGYAAVASETGALAAAGLGWRELAAGEALYCSNGGGCGVERYAAPRGPYPCAFEYVYLLRPDSVFEGVAAHLARKRMGQLLAEKDWVEADAVVPVPDSGRSAALGYAQARGLPLDEALYVNRFLGRSFIASPWVREKLLNAKYGVIDGVVRGRRLVVVDDSIVRGSTIARIARLLRAAGAREVHFRSAAPPVVAPCFLGVDVPSRRELAAYGRSMGELAAAVGVDSLAYGGVEDLYRAVGLPRLCLGCFTSRYPAGVLAHSLEVLESRFSTGRR